MSDLHKLAHEIAVTDLADSGKSSTMFTLGKKLRMRATRKAIRSLGVGGGLAGTLLLACRLVFQPAPVLDSAVLVTVLVGAVLYYLFVIVVGRRLSYYFSLLELYLLQQLIGEQARAEITCELTFRYFLGDSIPRTRQVFENVGKKSNDNAV